MTKNRRRQKGNSLLEFTLVGIPLIFVWISIVQMAIGMWHYHSLQYAVKMAGAYASVHGASCSRPGNSCAIQIKDAAAVLQRSSPGAAASTSVTFRTYMPDHATASPTVVTCTLSDCLTNMTPWPPTGWGEPGYEIDIKAVYTYSSGLAMFIPGSGSVRFGVYNLSASTRQPIVF
jgi:Flp pilus assembly protein TadG